MSADAQPPAPEQVADRPPQRAERLPGLWLICVFFGAGGMLGLSSALTMAPQGAFLRGAMAMAAIAVAAGLWLRLRPAWYAGLALAGLDLVRAVILLIRGAFPNLPVFVACCLIYLAIALYLWVRRRCFGRRDVPGPRVLSAPGVAAIVVVLASGVPCLLLGFDEQRQSFPALEAQVPVPLAEENGFLLAEQLAGKWAPQDDEEFEDVLDGMLGFSPAPSAEWVAQARALLQKDEDFLARARELAAKPHFVEVTERSGLDWLSRPMPWLRSSRWLAHLLSVSAHVRAADGRWEDALNEAHLVVTLGMLLTGESKSTIQSLVGRDIVVIGLATERDVAGIAPDITLLKAHLAPPLPEDELRRGFNLGMAGDFQGEVGLFDELSEMSPEEAAAALGIGEPAEPSPDLLHRHLRASHLIKPNVTANIFGRRMSQLIIHSQTYAPPPPDPFGSGTLWDIAREIGWLRFARDPMGVIIGAMMLPAMDRYVEQYYDATAAGRMTQVYIALRCYQLEEGKLPAGLDELVPQYLEIVPVDPFTGGPLCFEPDGANPRLWSVGPDGVTGPLPTDAQAGGDDVVVYFAFAAPEPETAEH